MKAVHQKIIFLITGLILGGSLLQAQNILAKLEKIEPDETQFAGFVLNNEQEINVEAVGAHLRSKHWVTSIAWILDADTRKLAWELTDANSKWKNRKLREYQDRVTLPAGRYELYYANYPGYDYYRGWSFSRFFFRNKDDEESYDDSWEDYYITVTGNGRSLSKNEVESYQETVKNKAAVSLTVRRDDQYVKQGFELSKNTDMIVYCLGEGRDDGVFDYGWILDTKTRKYIWKFDYYDSDYAGGNEKNRMVRETISLPAGKYAAFYVSDDSHSPREWNANPPYDPAFWGLSLYVANEGEKNRVTLFDYEPIPAKNVIIEFTRMRDDDYVSKGFTLKKDLRVRIYALGEGRDGEMYDYGWIAEAKTGRRVWEMDYYDTEHAGGNSKNRMVDDVLTLKKGNYLAHYVTDGSHSYRHWNTSPPFDQENWGLTIMAADDDFRSDDVAEYNQEDDRSILARIVEVRDHFRGRDEFQLKKDGEIRIYAIGEGRNGSMFDYAWLEEEGSGKVVWEMTYRKTDHAGGAGKNRVFDDTVFLPAGSYVIRYESDDSHSFRDWNASPPRDPVNYGVTVYMIEE